MKKLLYILLFITSYASAQTTPVTMQFRSFGQRYPIYTWSGIPGGGYDTLWNAAKIRQYVSENSSAYTFSNGLTNDGSGNVTLGGSLLNTTIIDGATHGFAITQPGGSSISIGNSGAGVDFTNANYYAVTSVSNNVSNIGISRLSDFHASSLVFNPSGITLNDEINNRGITNASNYMGNATANTLITKRYADSVAKAKADSVNTAHGLNPDSTLRPNKNLYDIPNKATARLNLGITPLLNSKLDTTGKSLNAKRDFGAKGDSKVLTDVVTNGTTTITSASASFVSGDIGKTVGIAYGGTDTLTNNIRKPFRSTIVTVNSATSITLANAVPATIAGPRTITGVSMSAFSNTVTCTGCTMTQNDKGKQVTIPGVGPINNQTASHSTGTFQIDSNSTCYIYAVTSSTTFLVTKKALYSTSNRTVTIPGAWTVYGTDDTAPLNNAVTAAIVSRKKLELPEGKYLTTKTINAGSNLTIEGYGAGSSILYPVGENYTAIVANHAASDTITRNVHFRNFEIDGMALGTNLYSAGIKAILILPAIDVSLEYMTIRNSSATGFGSDFMKNYLLLGNKFIHNGRQGFEFQSIYTIPGGAGAGIGTGKWQDEGGSAISNYADNNFSNGLFWEGQERGQFTGGVKVLNNFTTFNNSNGIGDIGTDGNIISNNYSIYDGSGIRSDQSPYQTASNLTYAKNGLYANNIIRNSFGTPMVIITKYGGQHITGNDIENTLPLQSTAGVKLISVDSTGNNIKEILFQGNKIKGIRGDGLSIETGNSAETHGSVVITGNTLVDNGLSNASPGAGIVLKAKTLNLFNRNNIAFDDRVGSARTQAYGFYVPAAQTTGSFFYGENSFTNNITAPDLYTNLTATSNNIGQPLIYSESASPFQVKRNMTNGNVSVQVTDNGGSSVFFGKAVNGDIAFGTTNNMSTNLFAVTALGNIKIPTTPATAPNTYDILVRDNSGTGTATVIQKIPSNTFLTTATLPEKFLRLIGSGTGSATTISIPHGQTGVTSASIAVVTPINAASSGIQYVTCDATNINIVYQTAPVTGTNNLSFNVFLKP